MIYPCLWFDGKAQEAATFYTGIFADSLILSDNGMVVRFKLEGQDFMGLNGGPQYKFTPAISFFVMCESIDEADKIWAELIVGGFARMPINTYPWSQRYGWLQDKYGVNWQINLHTEGSDQKIQASFLYTQSQLGNAKKAIEQYTGLFGNSKIMAEAPYAEESDYAGMLMYSSSTLDGYTLVAMDGPGDHEFVFNEALSFVIECETQAEIDHYWDGLIAGGGSESMCGWLKDPFGISWQVVPKNLGTWMGDPIKGPKVVQAFMKMKRFDIKTLEEI